MATQALNYSRINVSLILVFSWDWLPRKVQKILSLFAFLFEKKLTLALGRRWKTKKWSLRSKSNIIYIQIT